MSNMLSFSAFDPMLFTLPLVLVVCPFLERGVESGVVVGGLIVKG